MRPVRLITVCSLFVLTFSALPAPASADVNSDRMIEHINQVRAAHSLRPLHPSPALIRSAGRFSSTMMSSNRFGHSGRIQASGFRRMGEALAMHYGRGLGISGTVRR